MIAGYSDKTAKTYKYTQKYVCQNITISRASRETIEMFCLAVKTRVAVISRYTC